MRFLILDWAGTLPGNWCVAGHRRRLNYEEARAAESRADFVHKLKIVLKELRESGCWLRMAMLTELLPEARLADLLDECQQLSRVVGKSIVTTKENN